MWGATSRTAFASAGAEFQSTRPVWGATNHLDLESFGIAVSIHAPRVGRDAFKVLSLSAIVVSIHAPRVGRDMISDFLLQRDSCFNPRAPCGARPTTRLTRCATARFQSTRPVWGATWFFQKHYHHQISFNPRAPCGARHGKAAELVETAKFQSTRPVWGATVVVKIEPTIINVSIHAPRVGRDFCTMFTVIKQGVSIHAPRVGRDTKATTETAVQIGFNPRAPCGARPACRTAPTWGARFQSTRPVWGATCVGDETPEGVIFQSTRPVWGATFYVLIWSYRRPNFNPRAPCGARQRGRFGR